MKILTGAPWFRWKFITGAVLLIPVILLLTVPVNTRDLVSRSNPLEGHAEAKARLEAMLRTEKEVCHPDGGSLVLAGNGKAGRVAVLFHGYTRCPRQMLRLGTALREKGYAVLIPRVPHHGLANRMTGEQELLTAKKLAVFTNAVIDIAHGYGDTISVAGFSMGGVMAAWAAQNRSDVERAVIIAPALGVHAVPAPLTRAAVRLALLLPNAYLWWNPQLKENNGPPYVYPRFSTHGLAQIMRLGCAVMDGAGKSKPAARTIQIVTNAGDFSVNNRVTAQLECSWRERGAERLCTREIPGGLHIGHELFEPYAFDSRYERTLALIAVLIAP